MGRYFCPPMMMPLPDGLTILKRGLAASALISASRLVGVGAGAAGVIGQRGRFAHGGILSLPLRVAEPSSGPALTQRPPKWHVFYNRFMLTINQRMRNVFKGRHGPRVKAKLEAAFG